MDYKLKLNKMKIYKLQLLIIFFTVLISCENESIDSNKETTLTKEQQFYSDFITSSRVDGSVLIQSSTNVNIQKERKNIRVSEQKSRDASKENEIKVRFSDLENNKFFGKNKSFEETINLNNDFFGKKLNYYVEKNGKAISKSSIYIPDLLTVDFSGDVLQAGSKITWNVDSNNPNGVVVILRYDPINQLDVALAYNFPQSIIKTFVLPESMNSYIVKPNDLDRFPNNADISVSVLRAAGIPPKNGGEAYVSAVTEVYSSLRLVN